MNSTIMCGLKIRGYIRNGEKDSHGRLSGITPLAYLSTRDYPGYKRPKYITTTDRNIPEGTIPLEEKAKVLDAKGENLGAIERLCTGSEDHLVTHLLISQGLLSKEKKMIPSDWVKNVKEDTIRLSVEKALIERLPEFSARE